jgi:alkyldihydroxyacetonephosphate synthase
VTTPTPPTPIDAPASDVVDRLDPPAVDVPVALLERLSASGAHVETGDAARAEAGRDWWPLAVGWAADGAVPRRPAAVVRTSSTDQVAAVLTACRDARVPVTPAGGRSGVCGGSVPAHGGIALDLTADRGLCDLDEPSLLADVRAGTFGPALETALGTTGAGYTLGHWPQSFDLSTVGGWLACRSAGQYSTRYGKIEDMVVGLEVVLADGRVVRTDGRGPRAATGPSLTQLFVGSEGTLGVITQARLRIRPTPRAQQRRAVGFPTFGAGLEACRRVLRRGATPAVLRLYDHTESARHFDRPGLNVLIVLDEGDPVLVDATMAVVEAECAGIPGAHDLEPELVARWLTQRNDVSALAPLWRAGVVVDTVEVAGRWSVLPALFEDVIAALERIEGTIAASAHQSHAYPDGACLYFTFAGTVPGVDPRHGIPRTDVGWRETYYRKAWDTVIDATMERGAAISHHHGIGLQRARFMPRALGTALGPLQDLKDALDPVGILNPGKLGLRSPFGPTPWP